MRKRALIKGTIILTAAGLIARVLGFVNRIYMAGIIGTEGIGLYQLIFPIYMICYTLCCSGLFTAISRLTAEEKSKGHGQNAIRVLQISMAMSVSLSFLCTIVLFFGADFISTVIVREPRISMGLKIISVTIPFTAVAHSIKAYFYGQGKPTLPAITQILEQIVRITVIYFLAMSFVAKGLAYACAVAVLGMSAGEIVSCILVYAFFAGTGKKKSGYKVTERIMKSFYRIQRIAVPLTANRLLTTVLLGFETMLIPGRLKNFGLSHSDAISTLGALSGMAFPIIVFPTVITTSASLLLLPAISEAHTHHQASTVKRTVSETIRFCLLLGFVFMFYFLSFGNWLGNVIYHLPYVGELIVSLSIICPLLYLQTTLGSLLNGLDLHLITFKNNIIGLLLRIGLLVFLVPKMGVRGYFIGLLFSLLLVTVLDIFYLMKATSFRFQGFTTVVLPCLCCGGAVAIQYLFKDLLAELPMVTSDTLLNLLLSGVYFGATLVLLFMTKCIRIKDLRI